ncbi:molybdenum cofactor guanylyltransferase [Aneurinibacillus sp. BA2021]|nr:molybdenum cofactor guanylyltransferase [Aneurinibacillus sp. BA2021]
MDGIILAGGQSSRMGQPKELLPLAGMTLIERTLRLVADVADCCTIISNHPERLAAVANQAAIYPDDRPGQGPLGGIATAMRTAASDVLLVVACDMPALTPDVLQRLCAHHPLLESGYDIIYPEWKGRAHPLCALYHRRLYPLVLSLLAQERRRMFDLIDGGRAFRWNVHLDAADPFCNVNTMQEYKQFQKGERP